MQLQRRLSRVILFLAVATLLTVGPFIEAQAAYSVGFKSDTIEIISPTESGLDTDGVFSVQGNTCLDCVWFALRGPNGETETIPIDAAEGRFADEIQLRFGAGEYTVWAGDNAHKFSGEIRFELRNRDTEEVRYLAPSAYVDSDNADIGAQARSLTGGLTDDAAKAAAIHSWVTANISYDCAACRKGDEPEIKKASTVLSARMGICRDYAMLTAALARSAGIPARVVYGQAATDCGVEEYHAWNELLIDGRWVSLDTCWDAGYVENGAFVRAPSDNYLFPAAGKFSKTHSVTKYTIY